MRFPFKLVRFPAIAALVLGLVACTQPTSSPSSTSTGSQQGAISATQLPATPRRVGLLVPLNGRLSAVGQDLARAAEMAVIERGGEDLVLVTGDTASTAEGAVQAAREMLQTAPPVDVILGPLTGDHTARIAPLARQQGVAVVSFSSQSNIAGDGVFVLGYGPGEQVRRVVRYAVGRGHSRIAALAPNDAYGRAAVDSLRDTLADAPGAQLAGVAFYGADGIDAGARMRELAGGGPPPFDALLIADGGNRLRTVSQQLAQNGISPVDVRLLGTMLWQQDRAALLEPTLRGAWYAAVADSAVRDFTGRFRRAYGRDPDGLAVLGYDGIIVTDDAARAPATAASRLLAPQGYQGEAGFIRFVSPGIAEHGLAILELSPGGPIVIEPAPLLFDGTS